MPTAKKTRKAPDPTPTTVRKPANLGVTLTRFATKLVSLVLACLIARAVVWPDLIQVRFVQHHPVQPAGYLSAAAVALLLAYALPRGTRQAEEI
jgi:hypothetical protein